MEDVIHDMLVSYDVPINSIVPIHPLIDLSIDQSSYTKLFPLNASNSGQPFDANASSTLISSLSSRQGTYDVAIRGEYGPLMSVEGLADSNVEDLCDSSIGPFVSRGSHLQQGYSALVMMSDTRVGADASVELGLDPSSGLQLQSTVSWSPVQAERTSILTANLISVLTLNLTNIL